jgi:uncharacterized Rmd1/YagE family protein
MDRIDLVAIALKHEVDLNRLSSELQLGKRFRWEEPMTLAPSTLTLAPSEAPQLPRVSVYSFGAVVFTNCGEREIAEFFGAVGRISPEMRDAIEARYRDDYALLPAAPGPEVTNDFAKLDRADGPIVASVSDVLAKSVALERIEEQIDALLDEIESLITRLEEGKFGLSDRAMARFAAKILSVKYASISHIMVLEKPAFTWENESADRLYLRMSDIFELSGRFRGIQVKSEALLSVTEVFTTLSHARRSTRLEYVVIALIAIEVAIYVADLVLRGH